MRLTRREAMAALATGGGAGLAMSALPPGLGTPRTGGQGGALPEEDVRRLVAVAEVIFPPAVPATADSVAGYVSGLSDGRRAAIHQTLEQLDQYLYASHGRPLTELSVTRRDDALRSLGVARVGSSPTGSLAERVRFYLVNQLLYGLYTTPAGSKLAGIQNPVGHPGGYESYQQPPNR